MHQHRRLCIGWSWTTRLQAYPTKLWAFFVCFRLPLSNMTNKVFLCCSASTYAQHYIDAGACPCCGILHKHLNKYNIIETARKLEVRISDTFSTYDQCCTIQKYLRLRSWHRLCLHTKSCSVIRNASCVSLAIYQVKFMYSCIRCDHKFKTQRAKHCEH